MNGAKTKSICFASKIKYSRIRLADHEIKVNDSYLKYVPTFKYLGVILDTELTFNSHVKDLKKKLGFKSCLLGRLKYFVPTKILLKLETYRYFTDEMSLLNFIILFIRLPGFLRSNNPSWCFLNDRDIFL